MPLPPRSPTAISWCASPPIFKLDSGDTLLGYATQTSPGVWTFTYTVNLVHGTYTVFAQAEDNYGLFSDPFALSLTVQ
jgi:hypothetical protein